MREALKGNMLASPEDNARLWNYLCTGTDQTPDPCMWRGVECTEGIVTTFVFVRTFHEGHWRTPNNWEIEVDYLPSTLCFLHLQFIHLIDEWVPERLPRDLRYFFSMTNYIFQHNETQRGLNLRKLPQKLEELIVFQAWFAGNLLIDSLPPSLRLLNLRMEQPKQIFISNEALPDSLETLALFSHDSKAKIYELSGKKLDPRVKKRNIDARKLSGWYQTFEAQTDAIVAEFGDDSPPSYFKPAWEN